MKTPRELFDAKMKLTDDEKKRVEKLGIELKSFVEKNTLDEAGIRTLSNVISELELFKETYLWRFINALKQNHMI